MEGQLAQITNPEHAQFQPIGGTITTRVPSYTTRVHFWACVKAMYVFRIIQIRLPGLHTFSTNQKIWHFMMDSVLSYSDTIHVLCICVSN